MEASYLHYEVIEKLGEGGMGVVYLADDTKLDRKVALKFLPKQVALDEEVRLRFIQEAKSAALLTHPNIAQVHAIEEDGEQLFIVMEYVEGHDLKEAVQINKYSKEEKQSICLQIAEGLKAAHDKGVIHRDIKSANIRIKPDGQVKIMDFGLARIAGSEHITKEGTTLGTTAYMAPEQLMGGEADLRSDIWAYGVLVFEIFSGEMPFQGMYEQAIIYAISEEEPKDITDYAPDTPANIQEVINGCLQKLIENRYQNMTEVLDDLDDPDLKPRRKRAKRSLFERTPVLLGGIILVLIIFSSIVILQSQNDLFGNAELDKKYLAVLPVENIDGDTGMQAICNGLGETFSYKLSEIERYEDSYWVAPAAELRNENVVTASQANQKFGVNLAILSSMQSLKDSTRLTIELVDADNARRINIARVTVPSGDLALLEREGVRVMLGMLKIEVSQGINATLTENVPNEPEAYRYYLEGMAALQENESLESLNEAIRLFDMAIEADPEFALAYAGKGEAYWLEFETTKETEQVEMAEASALKALELNDDLVQVQNLLGLIKTGTGDQDAAIGYYYEALNIDAKNSAAYNGLAKIFFEAGNPEQAEQIYLTAIRLKPGYWKGYIGLGSFYLSTGEPEKAITQFEKVVQLTPKSSSAYSNLGAAYWYAGNEEKARQLFENSLTLEANPITVNNLATLYYIDGMYEEAAKMYQVALDAFPDRYDFWGNLATSQQLSGEKEKAIESYKIALEKAAKELSVNENNANVIADMGAYYSDIGELRKARSFIERALSINSEEYAIRFRAVSTYEKLGERSLAVKWLLPSMIRDLELQPELQQLVKSPEYLEWKDGIEENSD